MPIPDLEELTADLVSSPSMSPEGKPAVSDLLTLMQKVRERRTRERKEGDCADPENDCPDLVSPCCSALLSTVHGTLPVQVVCSVCEKSYLLRDLVLALPPAAPKA